MHNPTTVIPKSFSDIIYIQKISKRRRYHRAKRHDFERV